VTVKHRDGSYEVGQDSLRVALEKYSDAFVITDDNVRKFWLPDFKGNLRSLPPGEESKSLEQLEASLKWLADSRATRSSVVVALGGGVIGDLAGFAAATYMRGVTLIQIPTTLLAMVDSSVGGKVAINLPQGKNLVGAFYPPSEVIIDIRTLSTLPIREFNSGAAEIWKYGAIADWPLFESLELKPLGPGDERITQIVMRCVEIKRDIVQVDEFETTGRRATLNFGHTVGHAIENVAGYGQLLHGEAISIGMVAEASIGENLGISPPGISTRLKSGLKSQGLPVQTDLNPAGLIEAMRLDKKAAPTGLAFALLDGYGSCKLVPDVPEKVVLECLREHL